MIAFDARSDELVRLDARDRRARLAAGAGRARRRPAAGPGQPARAGRSPPGKLLFVSLGSGELQATMNLGRPLARTPVSDESGRHLYVLGRQDILFVLNRDPLGCAAVEYLGHPDGSIPCTPALLGRYLIIPENDSLTDSRWQVLVIDEEGSKVKPVQEVQVAGWTWQTPTASGQFVWATGDRGAFEAFAVGEYGSKSPFRSVAKMTPDARATGPGLRPGAVRARALVGVGPLRPVPPRPGARRDPDVAADRRRARRRPRSRRPARSWSPRSRTATSAAPRSWASSPTRRRSPGRRSSARPGPPSWSPSGESGRPLDPRPRRPRGDHRARAGGAGRIRGACRCRGPGAFALPAGLRLRLGAATGKAIERRRPPAVFARASGSRTPRGPAAGARSCCPRRWRPSPVAWQGGILVPGVGRARLPDRPGHRPVARRAVRAAVRPRPPGDLARAGRSSIAETVILADDVGRVRRLVLKTTPVPRLVAEAERTLDSRIVADPATTGAAVLVATADGRVRSLAARDLSPIGAWPLDASIAGRPVGLGDGGLVMDRAGGVLAFGRDGQKTWSIKLGAEVVGCPALVGPSLVVLTSDGVLHVLARADGAERDRRPLGVLPAGGPIAAGPDAMIPVAPGTFRPMALDAVAR